MGSRTLWLWMFVGSLAVTAVLGVMAILLPSIPFEGELLITSGLLTGYSLLGLMASIAIARGQLAWLAWIALALLLVSFMVWLYLIWFNSRLHYRTEETLAKTGGTPMILGVVALHTALLCLPNFQNRISHAVRLGTIAAASAVGVLLVGFLWELYNSNLDEWIARVTGAFAIPAALGTIAVPVLARIEFVSRRDGEEHTIDRHVSVWMRCPRCSHEGERPSNRCGVCEGCGLEITVTLAEPRCVCGYLLHGLPEPICPECGREIAEEHRWGGEARD